MPERSTPPRERLAAVAILARNNGYPDVAKWILARDKKAAEKRKVFAPRRAHVTKDGTRVRGGATFVRMDNPDITYEELER